MPLLQVSGLSFSFGDREILKEGSLLLDPGTRLALSGANGSGKTTLLRLIAGIMEAHGGTIYRGKSTGLGYLPQSGVVHQGKTLAEEVESAYGTMHSMGTRLEEIESQLADLESQLTTTSDRELQRVEKEFHRLVEEQHEIHESLESSGFYRRSSEIESVLQGLGFSKGDFEKPTHQFSGGWQMRIALAKVLLSRPDVLLLDEPTNYLDIEAREWLENWLNAFAGGVLMVSHDRYFLDKTIQGVAELYLGRLKMYKGNYTSYETRRALELELIIRAYQDQQEDIAKLEDFIRRFRYNASKAAMVQSRVKTLEKIEVIEIPEGLKKIHFHFPPAPRSGDLCLRVEGLEKAYPQRPLFRHLDFEVQRGEKIALVGKNGAGKSTLMKILGGQDTHFRGTVHLGANVVRGYFSQDVEGSLDLHQTVIEAVETQASTEMFPYLRGLLGAFLFRGDDIFKPVKVLSGGEKNRLALVRLLLTPANLLLMDEPTNHLDLASKDVLLDALTRFAGTVIFVSHDHEFIEALATRVLEVSEDPKDPEGYRRTRNFPGGYDYYRYRLNQELTPSPVVATKSAPPLSREEEKARKSQIRKLEKEEEELLSAIETLEQRNNQIMELLGTEEVYTHLEKLKKLHSEKSTNEEKISDLSKRWEEASEQLEQILEMV
ncbi:MAG: ABC-F family ATP-binding cassette domain-containing protein [Spirochaetales bacterium]|nr:ABC-F family ATP-binding cassette domain-containing protein [Spirochaetales bacterium]